MSADNDPSRNLPATAKRIREARSQGNVPRSHDLGHFAALGVATLLLYAGGERAVKWMQGLLTTGLRFDHQLATDPVMAGEFAGQMALRGILVVAAIGVGMSLVTIAASLALGGWNMTLQALQPDFSRLNPISGLGRLFNKQALVNTGKAVLLALVVGSTGTLYLKNHLNELIASQRVDLPQGIAVIATTLGGGMTLLVLVLGAWALIDVPLQKYQWAARLRMTREEVKQEHKQAEGSGEVKAKIRGKMREMARRRMMAAVPAADIVVMNPTHFAVALKYDAAQGGAPRVVAKGADRLAMRIRDLARESGVPVLQAPPLARALYTHVELEAEVPAVLFAAVAQVLAWVFQMRQAPMGQHRPPEVQVPPELDPLTNPDAGRPGRRRPATPTPPAEHA